MEKSMKRIISIISLVIAVLLLFTTCGIPRMFGWDYNTQYIRNSNSIRFSSNPKNVTDAEFEDKFPRLLFFYAVGYTTDVSSYNGQIASGTASTSAGGVTANSLAYAFNSDYSDSVPYIRPSGNVEQPVTSAYVLIDTPTTSSNRSTVKMFGFIDARTGERPDFPAGIENFYDRSNSWLNYKDYDYAVTYSAEPVPYEDGYAILLILYPEAPEEYQTEYLLLRENGLPFSNRIADYIGNNNGQACEYDENDPASSYESGGGTPAIFIFASCSFDFRGYTSLYTSYVNTVGNPILLDSLI